MELSGNRPRYGNDIRSDLRVFLSGIQRLSVSILVAAVNGCSHPQPRAILLPPDSSTLIAYSLALLAFASVAMWLPVVLSIGIPAVIRDAERLVWWVRLGASVLFWFFLSSPLRV